MAGTQPTGAGDAVTAMRFSFHVIPARFVERPNRFLVLARLADGTLVRAHCPDPGRLRELLIPGVVVYVSPAERTGRTTAYDLRFVEHPQNGRLISLDARVPNSVVDEALACGRLPMFAGYGEVRREVTLAVQPTGSIRSRIDFLLTDSAGRLCWLEVKSVTLVVSGCAQFPDAPTERGRRHVEELTHVVSATGDRAAILFVIQRPDAQSFAPRRETDPAFAKALCAAREAGVELYAYTCVLTQNMIELHQPVPVDLSLPAP